MWSRRGRSRGSALALLAAYAGCAQEESEAAPDAAAAHDHSGHSHAPPVDLDASLAPPDGSVLGDFSWALPDGWPRPPVPDNNPMSAVKVELGRRLFYDVGLSRNGTTSCASCHKPELAFTDGRAVGLGSTGELHSRSAMGLTNVGYAETLTWSNPLMVSLEKQAHLPIFGDRPVELGNKSIPELEARLREKPPYATLFTAAFPDEDEPVSILNVTRSLGAFQRTLVSGNSAYDRYQRGELDALSESARRGMAFVTTNEDHRFECNHCHGGLFFTDHITWEGRSSRGASPPYHQTGLYNIDGQGGYPSPNTGVFDVTLNPADMGKFKAPTLRNIALTAPYMHDGSIATLSEVIDHYAQGGRASAVGKTDGLLKPFEITAQEKADIIAFLESLTDEDFVKNPRFSDPWK